MNDAARGTRWAERDCREGESPATARRVERHWAAGRALAGCRRGARWNGLEVWAADIALLIELECVIYPSTVPLHPTSSDTCKPFPAPSLLLILSLTHVCEYHQSVSTKPRQRVLRLHRIPGAPACCTRARRPATHVPAVTTLPSGTRRRGAQPSLLT